MKRQIVSIDREKCDGCGLCIPNCHEGALQLIDGKATLVSELMCDGLGACIGHCPQGAITIEEREAQPYDEITTINQICKQGKNVVTAHLIHLKEHGETNYLKQAVTHLINNQTNLSFDVNEVISKVHNYIPNNKTKLSKPEIKIPPLACGCPGTVAKEFLKQNNDNNLSNITISSELTHWPIQLHLINPDASYFQKKDILLSADCVAYAFGNFHKQFLAGKSLLIACPKLDNNTQIYIDKLIHLINKSKINTITILRMEVPCCGGIVQFVQTAQQKATRKVPLKVITVSIQGELLDEQWL